MLLWTFGAYHIKGGNMNKLERFKEFAKTKPHLKKLIDQKEYTWQELFERYDIYGESDEIFNEANTEETITPDEQEVIDSDSEEKKESEGLGSILEVLAGIDTEKISEGLNGMKKILSVLSEVTKTDEAPIVSKRKMARPYTRDDDWWEMILLSY